MTDLQGAQPWPGPAGWIPRLQEPLLRRRLEQFPAVALLGPRQVGKTTLALQLAATTPSLYLDLEASADLARLGEPSLFLQRHTDKLVILDEVQRLPGLFAELRGLIDAGRRQGQASGRFLLLGFASVELIRQSSESLAGRIAVLELGGLHPLELEADALDTLWIRGGFPGSALATSDRDSSEWRRQFIRTVLERDIPQLGPRVPAETLRRFWTMLAHGQGSLLNAAELGRSLGVDGKTVGRYLDLLVDLLLVRQLPPLLANVGKRLVRSPKVLVRDIDLVLEWTPQRRWAIEIKRSLSPRLGKGFHQARADLQPERTFVVTPAVTGYPLADGVEVVGLAEMVVPSPAQAAGKGVEQEGWGHQEGNGASSPSSSSGVRGASSTSMGGSCS
jgi:predicted AAA+ superfamily ATPase